MPVNLNAFLIALAATLVGVTVESSLGQESQPKWIIAHKINQAVSPYTRTDLWFLNPPWYPACFGNLNLLGTEDSLDQYFDGPNYQFANGLEFDVWYNEPGDNINGYGADQQDIFGNDVTVGNWYVSHEPCGDEHVPLFAYIIQLKSKLDIYGTGRCALLYVDIKAPVNHQIVTGGVPFDPISQVRDQLRSGLGAHYDNINVIYSTAEWTDRGMFLQNDFYKTLRSNELVGIDEDNDDAVGDDTLAADFVQTWFEDLNFGNVYLSDDTDATRERFVTLRNIKNHPQIVGGWTVSSDHGIDEASNSDAAEFYEEGVNLFLVQNFFEGDDGTGAYQYLSNRIAADPTCHLATGTDRPWIPDVEVTSVTSDGQNVEFNTTFSHAVVGLPIEISGSASNAHIDGEYNFSWDDNGQTTEGVYPAGSAEVSAIHTYSSAFEYVVTFHVSLGYGATESVTKQIDVVELDESFELVSSGLTATANNPNESPEAIALLQAAVSELSDTGGVIELIAQSRWHPACQKLSNAVQMVHDASLVATNGALPLARKQLTRCGKAIAIRSLSDAIANGLDEGQAMFVNNIILQGTLLLADDMDLEALAEFCNATESLAVGDINGDGVVNLLDVTPFVEILNEGEYVGVADINRDGIVDLLDVAPFVLLLASG